MRAVDLIAAVGVLAVVGVLLTGKRALAYVSGKPMEIDLTPIGEDIYGNPLWLRSDAAASYLAMLTAATGEGVAFRHEGPRTAFRTLEEQTQLTEEEATSVFAAAVGYSPHQAGVALDFDTDGGTNATYKWLKANAARFSWVGPYPSKEPWHWEYRP